jgi:hypothetical protein
VTTVGSELQSQFERVAETPSISKNSDGCPPLDGTVKSFQIPAGAPPEHPVEMSQRLKRIVFPSGDQRGQ